MLLVRWYLPWDDKFRIFLSQETLEAISKKKGNIQIVKVNLRSYFLLYKKVGNIFRTKLTHIFHILFATSFCWILKFIVHNYNFWGEFNFQKIIHFSPWWMCSRFCLLQWKLNFFFNVLNLNYSNKGNKIKIKGRLFSLLLFFRFYHF